MEKCFESRIDDDWWVSTVESAKKRLEESGISLGDVSFSLGRSRYIYFREASVDLDNRQLQQMLAEADGNWKRVVNALCLERVVGEKSWLSDYVEVEEINWGEGGLYLRLFVSADVDDLLEKFGYADVDVQEMEWTLEEVLQWETNEILKDLENEHLAECRLIWG